MTWPHVLLCVGVDSGQHPGDGLVTDPDEKTRHWKAEWAPYYKSGPRGADYVLIRVRPTRLEVVSPGRGVVSDAKTWLPAIVDMQ